MGDQAPKTGILKRFLIGALVIVCASASATAYATWHVIDKVTNALTHSAAIPGIKGVTDPANAGQPQTLLLIGSDKRSKNAVDVRDGAYSVAHPNSDTMILLRLDPKQGASAIMSLPRDLKVEIPGHGIAKLNASYALGGAPLTVRTIKHLTHIHINHVINVDFHGFAQVVNALGCVYADVDRHYYNQSNSYAKIDIPAGYQRLCGQNALAYVRYRHTDTDLVRSARQQDLLRQIKQQVTASGLLSRGGHLLTIFQHYTASDIRQQDAALRLLRLGLASATLPIREVHFDVKLGPSYVYARPDVVRRNVARFLAAQQTKTPRGTATRTHQHSRRHAHHASAVALANVAALGKQEALNAVNQHDRVFPLYYPGRLNPAATFADQPRVYDIITRSKHRYPAYRMVFSYGAGFLGQYYGLQGTTWQDPPILAGPHETHTIHGRKFDFYWDGQQLRLIAWHSRHAVYWLSNTLLLTLTNKQMTAIAVATRHL